MMSIPTARELLAATKGSNGQPLAILGKRGKFSAEAVAFLATKEAGKDYLPVVKVVAKPKADKPAVSRTPAPAVTQQAERTIPSAGSYDPKVVRAWAEAEGIIEKGKRGRLSGVVLNKWSALDGGHVAERAKPVVRQADPITHKVKEAWIVENGTAIAITRCADTSKGGCAKAVQHCTHPAPIAPHYFPEGIAGQPMSLVKPRV